MDRKQLMARLDEAWLAFTESLAGLSDEAALRPGVAGEWSAKDLMAHVTTWEVETLKALSVLMAGGRPPKYTSVGGVDAFNARESAAKRAASLRRVRSELSATHARLVAFLETVPEEWFATEGGFRKRLRLDTWAHYKEHTASIATWCLRHGA